MVAEPGTRLDPVDPFRPLQPIPRRRVILRAIVGPLLWLVAFVVVALVVEHTEAIGVGIAIAAVAFVASTLLLAFLRDRRDRERRQAAERR